eukprot:COSAG01_NODE_42399_length_440_cov_1.199413_1_plen_27_part_10
MIVGSIPRVPNFRIPNFALVCMFFDFL